MTTSTSLFPMQSSLLPSDVYMITIYEEKAQEAVERSMNDFLLDISWCHEEELEVNIRRSARNMVPRVNGILQELLVPFLDENSTRRPTVISTGGSVRMRWISARSA